LNKSKKINLNLKLPNTKVCDIMFSGTAFQDTLYLATIEGIFRYNLKSKGNIKPDRFLTNYIIKHIQFDSVSKRIFAFTKGAGVYSLNGNQLIKIQIYLSHNYFLSLCVPISKTIKY
jgi:hypothetical protein